jgi:hypothetical protein
VATLFVYDRRTGAIRHEQNFIEGYYAVHEWNSPEFSSSSDVGSGGGSGCGSGGEGGGCGF